MKRKQLFIFFLFAIMLVLSSCSEETEQETKSIAEDGLDIAETLNGCDVISDVEGFPAVKESQKYNYETDYNPTWIVCTGVTDAKEMLYTNNNVYLMYYYKKTTKEQELLCGKPECEHNTEMCNAMLSSTTGIQYYNGFLYVVEPEEQFMLKKISLDGSVRENIGSIFVGGQMIKYGNSGNSVFWIIHRGYIYYTYSASASITSEDTYYLNNSNYIFRMSLEGDEKPECIMQLPYVSLCNLKGMGSYVYITTSDMDLVSRNLYRYNAETGKVEWFESLGDNIMDCTEKDDLLYYMQTNEENSEFTLLSYNINTKQKNEITTIHAQAWGIYHDDDFLYLMYGLNGPQEITRVFIMDWNYNIVANIELEESSGCRSWLGTDDDYIYISRMRTDEIGENESNYVIEYIEKEDLADGEYTIWECLY